MNKLGIILASLIIVFSVSWYLKPTTPKERNMELSYNEEEGQWWDTSNLSSVKTDEAWILDPEIPVNYVPVIGEDEVYMVLNDDGTVNRYRKRVKDDVGSWVWEDIVKDDEPVSFKTTEMENVFQVVADDGSESYVEYLRNADGSYAYVDVDSNGQWLNKETPKGTDIPKNFVSVDGKNLYAEVNEYGVILRFWEKIVDETGAVQWQVTQNSFSNASSGVLSPLDGFNLGSNSNLNYPSMNTPNFNLLEGQTIETNTQIETKITGGWQITYETVYTYVYNADGSLYATHKSGPYETERTQVYAAETDLDKDAGAIESTIDAELIRVSSKFKYEENIAASVMAELNSIRSGYGLGNISMSANGNATKLAKIFAADMAKYNYADIESPLYGSINNLASRYGVQGNISLNVWRCGEKTADEINTRFQTLNSARDVRLAANIREGAVAIVSNNGFFFVVEVFIA